MAKGVADDQVLGTIERRPREELRVSLRKFNGTKWLEIRVYFQAADGSMQPSPRGVSLSGKELQQLRTILQKLYREKAGRADVSPSTPAVQR